MALDYLKGLGLRVETRRAAARVLAHVRAMGPGVEVHVIGGGVLAQRARDGSDDSSHDGSFLGRVGTATIDAEPGEIVTRL